ncbi:Trimeric GatFAB AmidoTransferase(AdT) complex subunit [Puccinia graminis f. sp. tritici]|uniref:Trimeric GatFAB AmidoTransferase(AdT) complex subunit n=1 Tax=Puccinia graminis f. sp. tritici TaxID=56615 RepID=A0A5B0PP07_PUCGR|nr:Trimeric GatFAB AmidoTransferase(AdT) complex subunit [Puccinia graminis f. sp. tritici]
MFLETGIQEYFNSDVSEVILSAFRATVDFLKQRGAQLISISLPSTSSCLGAYYVIASAEASTQPEQLDEGSSTSVLSLVLRSTPRRMTTTDPSPRRQVAT